MKHKLCDISPTINDKLPEKSDDKSGVGVHYTDAFVKPMNVTLEDGTAVKCKRRGLKITLTVGDKKGEGLLRRLQHGPAPAAMLTAALQEAAKNAGVNLIQEPDAIWLDR